MQGWYTHRVSTEDSIITDQLAEHNITLTLLSGGDARRTARSKQLDGKANSSTPFASAEPSCSPF